MGSGLLATASNIRHRSPSKYTWKEWLMLASTVISTLAAIAGVAVGIHFGVIQSRQPQQPNPTDHGNTTTPLPASPAPNSSDSSVQVSPSPQPVSPNPSTTTYPTKTVIVSYTLVASEVINQRQYYNLTLVVSMGLESGSPALKSVQVVFKHSTFNNGPRQYMLPVYGDSPMPRFWYRISVWSWSNVPMTFSLTFDDGSIIIIEWTAERCGPGLTGQATFPIS